MTYLVLLKQWANSYLSKARRAESIIEKYSLEGTKPRRGDSMMKNICLNGGYIHII